MQDRIDCGDRFEKSLLKDNQALIDENAELLMLVSKLESKNELLRGHMRNIQVVMESRYNEDGLFSPLDGKETAKFVADVIKDYLEMEGK